MGKVSELHPLHLFLAVFFFLASPVVAQECCAEKTEEEQEECPNCLALSELKKDVGDFRWNTKLDLTFGRSPRPNYVNFGGKGEQQMVLGEKLLLCRTTESSNLDGDEERVNVQGFRTDKNQFFLLTLDSSRTPFGWYEGITEWDGSRVLKDPSGHVLIRTVWEKNRNTTATLSLGDSLLMETTTKMGRKSKVDPLSTLLGSPIKPKKVNDKNDDRDAARNFSEEHLLLQKISGDFTFEPEDGTKEEISSRVICEGRFLVRTTIQTSANEETTEHLTFLGFDSSKGHFQMFQFSQDVSWPKYWTGEYEDEDKTLTFVNPYSRGESIAVHFREDGGYTSTQTSEDDGELGRKKIFEITKKKRR